MYINHELKVKMNILITDLRKQRDIYFGYYTDDSIFMYIVQLLEGRGETNHNLWYI